MLLSRLNVGIDQYSRDSYAQLVFGQENQSDKTHFFVLAILQVEKLWTNVIAVAYLLHVILTAVSS